MPGFATIEMIHEMLPPMVNSEFLDQPIYGMAQVDGLLRLHGGTARRWIDGYDRKGHHYPPIIRARATGSELVTWGEFVEALLLAGYRDKGVLTVKLRPVVTRLREELQTQYPLATARLWLHPDGGELVRRVQEEEGLDPGLHLVEVVRSGQYAIPRDGPVKFTRPAREFLDRVDFGANFASRIRPLGKGTAVVLDPEYAFGSPAIRSIRTDVLAEEARTGHSVVAIANGYGLTVEEVNDAIRYESPLAA